MADCRTRGTWPGAANASGRGGTLRSLVLTNGGGKSGLALPEVHDFSGWEMIWAAVSGWEASALPQISTVDPPFPSAWTASGADGLFSEDRSTVIHGLVLVIDSGW